MARVTGSDASDPELEGTNLADQIFGLGGNDILIGFDGDDELEGGAGADELFGSAGFDSASYRASEAGVRIHLDVAFVTGGDATGDHLYSIEGLIGSAHGTSSSAPTSATCCGARADRTTWRASAAPTCSSAEAVTTCFRAVPARTSCAAAPASTSPSSTARHRQ